MAKLGLIIAVLLVIGTNIASFGGRKAIIRHDLATSVLIRINGLEREKDGKLVPMTIGCSGTYITPNVVLTAAHCFEAYQPKKVWVRDNVQSTGTKAILFRVNKEADLALLFMPYKHVYAKLGKDPHYGDKIMAVGSPQEFEFVLSDGIVALPVFPIPLAGEYVVSTAHIDHGSSGGGLFNADGELIGVNTMMTGEGDQFTLSVDLRTIRLFLGVK